MLLLIFLNAVAHHKPRVDHLLNHMVPIHVMNAIHHLSVQLEVHYLNTPGPNERRKTEHHLDLHLRCSTLPTNVMGQNYDIKSVLR